MAMAQLLGLDRQRKTPARNLNEDEAQKTPHQENIWFVLVHYDQYLSLVLGISPNLPEHSQTAPGLLERCTPSQRMSRLHSMATGRILQRNRVGIYNIVETMEIDKLLQQAAACMPAQWWLPPDWHEDEADEGTSCVVNRLMVHFAHYNILLQVHLPSMIRSLASRQYYSGTPTAVDSSREVLTRFTVFRSRHPAVSYCRGLDIFAFVASIALCLLHIQASSEIQIPTDYNSLGISGLVAHRRLAHRGLMERALRCIEGIARVQPNDKIISNIIPVFRKLLVFEEEAYRGVSYSIYLSPHAGQSKDSRQGVVKDAADMLCLDVPFCGTIQVERANMSSIDLTETSSSGEITQMTHILLGCFPPSLPACRMTPPTQQPSMGQPAVVAESCRGGKHQSNQNTTIASLSDSQPMLFNGNKEVQGSTTAPELIVPDIMSTLEGQSIPTVDADFFEHLWDIQ